MWSSTLGVEVKRIAEALNESNCAAASLSVRGRNARPAADRGKDSANEDLQYLSDEGRVVSEAIAKSKGDREHPLPDRNFGKDMIHQMRGRVGRISGTVSGGGFTNDEVFPRSRKAVLAVKRF